MPNLTIGQAAAAAGLATSTLRYYEQIGLLPAPARVNGRRRYDAAVVDRLTMITTAKEIGLSLDEIKILLDGLSPDSPPSERWQAIAAQKLPEVEALIRRAQGLKRILEMGLACECVTMAACMAALG